MRRRPSTASFGREERRFSYLERSEQAAQDLQQTLSYEQRLLSSSSEFEAQRPGRFVERITHTSTQWLGEQLALPSADHTPHTNICVHGGVC